jgi:hypothetical protein
MIGLCRDLRQSPSIPETSNVRLAGEALAAIGKQPARRAKVVQRLQRLPDFLAAP